MYIRKCIQCIIPSLEFQHIYSIEEKPNQTNKKEKNQPNQITK